MNSQLAAVCFAVGSAALFLLNRAPANRCSKTLWLPVLWLTIAASRNVGEWLSLSSPVDEGNSYIEGSPVDRAVLGVLVAAGLATLSARSSRTVALLRSHAPIVAFFLYALISVSWSEYPLVSVKRWFRGFGDLVMVLVVLTDLHWVEAIKRSFARVGFVLLPVSVLFVKYYPNLGRAYGRWDGAIYWTGVASAKNGLGMVCLVCGLASLWRFFSAFQTRRERASKRILLAHGTVVAVAAWLMVIADSKTSLACFALAGCVIGATRFSSLRFRPALLHLTLCGVIFVSFAVRFLGVGSSALEAIGRDSSLTGRTEVWDLVLGFVENPLLGEGYESFWLGSRLERIIEINGGMNQAHNGYIEVYLNLGLVGILLLSAVLWRSYWGGITGFRSDPELSSLKIGYFLVAVIYNFTEGSFKMMSAVWFTFLLTTMVAPRPRIVLKTATVPADGHENRDQDVRLNGLLSER